MRRIGLVTITVLMVAVGVLLSGGGAASAHAFLVRTVPASGARLDHGPSELVLEFTEALEARPVIIVRTISGTRIDGLRTVASDDPAIVRVAMPTVPRGVYVVGWEGVADDGHRSEGTWAFAVGDVAGVTIPAPAQSQQPGSPLVVALTWIGLLLLTVSAAATTGAGSLRVAGPARRATVSRATYVCVGAAVVVLAVRVAAVAGSSSGVGVSDALSSRVGRLGFAGAAFAGAAFCVVRWKAAGVVLLSAAASSVVASGHVLGPGRAWVGVVTVVHALLGLWWVSSLVGVLAAVRWQPDRLDGRIRLHSRRAVVIVPVAVAAGLATALGRLPTLGRVADTTYGRWVIVKAALIAAALAAAFLVRRSVITGTINTVDLAAVPSASPAGSAALSPRWVRVLSVEMVMIVGGVGAGVVLSSVAPPRERVLVDLGPSPVPAPTVTMAELSGNHQLVVQAGPGRLQIRLLAPGSEPPLRSTCRACSGGGTRFDERRLAAEDLRDGMRRGRPLVADRNDGVARRNDRFRRGRRNVDARRGVAARRCVERSDDSTDIVPGGAAGACARDRRKRTRCHRRAVWV